jgi:hypothetical protein
VQKREFMRRELWERPARLAAHGLSPQRLPPARGAASLQRKDARLTTG